MNKINTKNYENIITSVKIDDRENTRKEYALKQYSPLNPSIHHLDVGDYVFKGYNGIEICFEYKTGVDFINSITEDNHLHNQVYEMIKEYDWRFIIVECENLKEELDSLYYSTGIDIGLGQINSAIAEFNRFAPVMFTQTIYQAFDLMMRQSGKVIENRMFHYAYGKKSTNTALNYLASIRGLKNQAETIVRKLNLHTWEDINIITKEDLMSIDGIGDKKAEKILNQIHSR